MTALVYAARYADEPAALAVAGAYTPTPQSLKEWALRGALTPAAALAPRVIGFDRVETANRWLAERLGEDVDEVERRADELREDAIDPTPAEYEKVLAAVADYRTTPVVLENISVPVLVLYGEDELFVEDHRSVYRDRIDDVRFRAVPNAGHNSHIENPEAFTAAVRNFPDGTM